MVRRQNDRKGGEIMEHEMIAVPMPRELYESICKLAKQNDLTKAAQTRILIKKGLEHIG